MQSLPELIRCCALCAAPALVPLWIGAALVESGAQRSGARERAGLVYGADISAMPAVIARMFALPKLRERLFPVALEPAP